MTNIAARLLAGLFAAAALSSCSAEAESQPKPAAPKIKTTSDCRAERFEDTPLTVCTADPDTHKIHMALGPKDGAPYRSLATFAASRPADAAPVAFAMNGGMFDDLGKPVGYYVETGERLHTLNRAKGPGNFHLLPNGVFYIRGDKWVIRTADDFYKNVSKRPDFGTQSGPMLVIAGKLHPKLAKDGESKFIRNAVGVDAQGSAHFVISDAPISFGKLARYFRDELKTPNALFLDGNVSALWDPAKGRLDTGAPIGPLIVAEQSGKSDG